MIELFTSIKFKTVVNLSLSDIHNNNGDVNKTVKDKLIDKFEGKCSKHGYIKKRFISYDKTFRWYLY